MGAHLANTCTIAVLGAAVYWLIRAMGMRPYAELVKLLCYALGGISLLQWFMELYVKVTESPLAKLIANVNAWLER